MLAVLRHNRVFRLLWVAQAVSTLGDFLLVVTLPYYVFESTGSLASAGAVYAAEVIPQILVSAGAGVIADRARKRRILVAANTASAVGLLGLLVGHPRLGVVVAVAFIESCFAQLLAPARNALVPLVVNEETLAAANSLDYLGDSVVRLAAPPIGGLLFVWGGLRVPVVIDAATFVVAGALLYRLPRDMVSPRVAGPMLEDFRDGTATIVRSSRLVAMVTLFAVVMFGQGILNVSFVAFAAHIGGAAAFGTLIGSQGAGAIIGATTATAAIKVIGPEWAATGGMLACGSLLVMFLVVPSLAVAAAAMVLIGVAVVFATVGATTIIQMATPPGRLGRVFGTLAALAAAATLLGLGTASQLGRLVGDRPMVAIAGAVVAGAGVICRLVMNRQAGTRVAAVDQALGPDASGAE